MLTWISITRDINRNYHTFWPIISVTYDILACDITLWYLSWGHGTCMTKRCWFGEPGASSFRVCLLWHSHCQHTVTGDWTAAVQLNSYWLDPSPLRRPAAAFTAWIVTGSWLIIVEKNGSTAPLLLAVQPMQAKPEMHSARYCRLGVQAGFKFKLGFGSGRLGLPRRRP